MDNVRFPKSNIIVSFKNWTYQISFLPTYQSQLKPSEIYITFQIKKYPNGLFIIPKHEIKTLSILHYWLNEDFKINAVIDPLNIALKLFKR